MIRPLHDELLESITIIKITTEPTTEASLLHSTVSIETEKIMCLNHAKIIFTWIQQASPSQNGTLKTSFY